MWRAAGSPPRSDHLGVLLLGLLRRWLALLRSPLVSLALRFGFERRLRVRRSGLVGDLAHERPVLFVGEGDEAIVAVEFNDHRLRKPKGIETIADLVRQVGR